MGNEDMPEVLILVDPNLDVLYLLVAIPRVWIFGSGAVGRFSSLRARRSECPKCYEIASDDHLQKK